MYVDFLKLHGIIVAIPFLLILVSYHCIINHHKLNGLQQPIIILEFFESEIRAQLSWVLY